MMSTNKIFFLSAVLLGLSACAKDTFTTYTGNMPSEDKIERLAPGMGREQVRELLGSPSSVVSLDRDTWIYMSAEIERRLLVVKFGQDGKVADIKHIDKSKGREIEVSEQETAVPEQEQGFFRKYFGGVGQITPFGGGTDIDEQ